MNKPTPAGVLALLNKHCDDLDIRDDIINHLHNIEGKADSDIVAYESIIEEILEAANNVREQIEDAKVRESERVETPYTTNPGRI